MFNSVPFLLTLLAATAFAGYAGSTSGNYHGKAGGDAGASYGYGYGGGFNHGGIPFAPPHFPFDFNGFFQGTNNNALVAYSSISVDVPIEGNINAESRLTYDGLQHFATQIPKIAGATGGSYSTPGGFAGSFASPGGYGTGYGYSSGSYPAYHSSNGYGSGSYGQYSTGAHASIGGGAVRQHAYLSPENPSSPNVNVRFGSSGGSPYGQSYGVYSSSSSSSANINGRPYNHRHSTTAVNDNGKISSYSVHSRK